MRTLKSLYQEIRQQFKEAGLPTPELDARLLIAHAVQIPTDSIFLEPDLCISDSLHHHSMALAKVRISGKPVSRIIGVREFYGFKFKITEDVLDPRPDTEILIDSFLKAVPDRESPLRLLDLGTGSGCLAVTLATLYPNAKVVAVDLSDKALAVAAQNAGIHAVQGRVEFRQGSWWDALGPEDRFDVIVSNPPYIPESDIPNLATNVRDFDPILSLTPGATGLESYEILFSKLFLYLNNPGFAFFEIGINQCGQMERIADKYSIRISAIHPDYGGIPRVVEIFNGDNLIKK